MHEANNIDSTFIRMRGETKKYGIRAHIGGVSNHPPVMIMKSMMMMTTVYVIQLILIECV